MTIATASRVFVIEPPRDGFDLSSAEKFGPIIPIFDSRDRRCSVFKPDEYRDTVWEVLAHNDYNPAVDYFIMIGAMLPVSLTLAAICEHLMVGESAKVLMFSSHDDSYVERV